jgi:hypothetical protein
MKNVKMEAVKEEMTMDSTPPSEAPPAETPSAPSNEAPVESGSGTGITVDEPVDSEEVEMFGDLDDDLFNDEVKDESQPSVPEPEIPPAPVEAPPSAVEAPPPVVAEPAPVEPEAIIPPQPEAPVVSSVPEQPVEVAVETPPVDYAAQRETARTELEKHYALSKEDADLMISEPEKVLPKLASQMYVEMYENVMRSVQQMLPNAVQHINHTSQVGQKDEDEFYTSWPALKEHSKEVLRIGQMYRQMNPTAPKEQFIREVGLQSAIALKLPIDGVPGMAPSTTAPAAPVTPPYVPPQGGSVNTPPAPAPSGNAFGDLADEWEELERN